MKYNYFKKNVEKNAYLKTEKFLSDSSSWGKTGHKKKNFQKTERSSGKRPVELPFVINEEYVCQQRCKSDLQLLRHQHLENLQLVVKSWKEAAESRSPVDQNPIVESSCQEQIGYCAKDHQEQFFEEPAW